jgi:hypothetical protein
MYGGLRGDDLYGFGGADKLRGNRASDCLSGGPDTDELCDTDLDNFNQPDDSDTLWGGGAVDRLDAKDGDSYDTLNGGQGTLERCEYDPSSFFGPGDVVSAC